MEQLRRWRGRLARPVLASLLLVLSAPGTAAQEPGAEPASSPDILVTGDPVSRREAWSFVERHAVVTRNGQYARWHEPLCVRTWGLPIEYNALISNRVMDVAERIGARTNRAELCRPNVRIGFTTEPQRMIDEVAQHYPIVLGFHYARQLRRLTRVNFPVQAWYATTTRSSGAESLDQVGYRGVSGAAGSRLSQGISSGFAHVLILVDSRVAAGNEAESVADLIAFLALAQSTLAPDCETVGTVLNLLNEDCPPSQRQSSLTLSDIAYLRALYAVDPELAPQSQRGALAVRMGRELDGE